MTSEELRTICLTNGIVVSLTGLIRERDAAKLLDVSARTLRDWRSDGIGPRPIRLGGQWRYSLDELATCLTPAEMASAGETWQKRDFYAIDGAGRKQHDAPSLAKKACALCD